MKVQNIFKVFALIALFSVAAVAQSGKSSSIQQVRDVDQPAKQTFNKTNNLNIMHIGTVPEGKALVIETITGRAITQTGLVAPMNLQWHDDVKDEWVNHYISPSYQMNGANITLYTQNVKIFIPAGSSPTINWLGDNTLIQLSSSVSGYYVDVP